MVDGRAPSHRAGHGGPRKSFPAWGGLATIGLMALMAPLLAFDHPLLWWQEGAIPSSPWLASLFDRNCFPGFVDVLLNVSMLWCALALALLLLGRGLLGRSGLAAWRRSRWGRITMLALLLSLLAGILDVSLFPRSSPWVDYHLRQEQLRQEGTRVLALYPPIPFSPRVPGQVHAPFSMLHPLGTDEAGLDIAAMLIHGARASMFIGLGAVLIYVPLGALVGLFAGYRRGLVDALVSRIIEIVLCIPSMLLVLALVAFFTQPGIVHILLLLALVRWPGPARLARSEALRIREADYVVAARVSGFSSTRIILDQVLPNALPPLLVSATFGVATCILLESTLSFLGLSNMDMCGWGEMLEQGRQGKSWTLILAPGAALLLAVGSAALLGERLRTHFNPRAGA